MKSFLFLLTMTLISYSSFARGSSGGGGGSGGHSFEFGVGLATASQDDINSWVVASSGQSFNNGTEFSLTYIYRFSSSIYAIAFRPGYFTQKNSGAAIADLTATTFMPMLRIYPLENSFIRFFMQLAMGFGTLSGTLSKSGASTSISGTAFGAMAGIGANFCFTETHCMTVEGNYRYLPIPRSTTSNANGSLGNGMTTAGELEWGGLDAQNTLSGVQGLLAYTIQF